MATAKARATIQVEFEAVDEHHARDALARLQGEVRHGIEFPSGIKSSMTGLLTHSLVVSVTEEAIDRTSA